MQCWFLYKKFETKGQKCPVSQITDRFAFCETRRRTLPWVPKVFFLVGALSTWLKCTWVKWKSTFSKNSLPSTRPKSLLHAGTNRDILDLYVYHFRIVLHIRKALRIGRDKLYIRLGLRRARFAKYIFWNLHILPFRCFIPCFRVIARRKRTVVTLDIFISVQVYSFRFVSQNTEINKTENRSKYTNLVFFVVYNLSFLQVGKFYWYIFEDRILRERLQLSSWWLSRQTSNWFVRHAD